MRPSGTATSKTINNGTFYSSRLPLEVIPLNQTVNQTISQTTLLFHPNRSSNQTLPLIQTISLTAQDLTLLTPDTPLLAAAPAPPVAGALTSLLTSRSLPLSSPPIPLLAPAPALLGTSPLTFLLPSDVTPPPPETFLPVPVSYTHLTLPTILLV